jgi:hypothetical protein
VSKKITLLLVFIIVSMQTNFAMEQKKSSMSLTSLMNGRFDKGLVINRFSLSDHLNKKSQILNDQLQEVQSKINKLSIDIDQRQEPAHKNLDFIVKNFDAKKAGFVVRTVLIEASDPATMLTTMIDVKVDSTNAVNYINNTELISKENMDNLEKSIKNYRLKSEENIKLLNQIVVDVLKLDRELIKVNERKNNLKKIHASNKKTKAVVCLFIQDSKFYYPIHESITVDRDPIEPIDRWMYEQELHKIFSGSDLDSESTMMSPYHPGHASLVSNFFISSSDASDDEYRRCNAGKIICVRIILDERPQDTSDEGPQLEELSESDWDSEALEYNHNWALLTDDAYLPHNNIYDFLHAQNNS